MKCNHFHLRGVDVNVVQSAVIGQIIQTTLQVFCRVSEDAEVIRILNVWDGSAIQENPVCPR